MIELLLKHGADPTLRNSDCNALDALCLCSTDSEADDANRAKIAERFLQVGLKFDEPGLEGETPLVVAANRGNRGIVSTFLDHGADPNTRDKKGNSLLHNVASGDYLLSDVTAALLVERGADINALNTSGATALHVASYNGYEWVVKALLRFPACDREAKNRGGQTALELARQKGFPAIVELLSAPRS